MSFAIRVENLGKSYRLGATHAGSLRELVNRAWTGLFGRKETLLPHEEAKLREIRERGVAEDGAFWALKDVSFEVKPGEVVGIIGRNGSGKSTLLKILSQITAPTTGRIELHGRVASLLEVGTGFHPELSGRENVFLNGAILGMTKQEIRRKFDEIVAFAEIEQFIDTPVKRYSSGMYVRLAFAVAAHLEPEILVVDEVLAVGDAEFQKKCLGKMADVARAGQTVLFVSHNMAAVHKLCDWAILLRDGYSVFKGNTHHTAQIYLNESIGDDGKFNASGRVGTPKGALITGARLERNGKISTSFFYGEAADLVVDLDVTAPIPVFSIELLLRQGDGTPLAFCPSGLAQNWHINGTPGKHRIRCQLPSLLLANGPYAIDLMLAVSGRYFVDEVLAALRFHIEPTAIGDMNWEFHQRTNQGCFYWDVKFAKESARMTDRMVEHKVSMVK